MFIEAKYDGKCSETGKDIQSGDLISWNKDGKCVGVVSRKILNQYKGAINSSWNYLDKEQIEWAQCCSKEVFTDFVWKSVMLNNRLWHADRLAEKLKKGIVSEATKTGTCTNGHWFGDLFHAVKDLEENKCRDGWDDENRCPKYKSCDEITSVQERFMRLTVDEYTFLSNYDRTTENKAYEDALRQYAGDDWGLLKEYCSNVSELVHDWYCEEIEAAQGCY